MKKYYKTKEIAIELSVENRVIYEWEALYNIIPQRTKTDRRQYTEEQFEQFKSIKTLKERGLTVDKIKEILKDPKKLDSEYNRIKALQHLEKAHQQITELITISKEHKP